MTETEELADEVKTFIVQSLACFDTPKEVAKAVKDEFDIELSRQRVQGYDPTKAQGKSLSEGWRTIFKATRDRYVSDIAEVGSEIAIANKFVRLRRLDRMSVAAEARGNLVLAAALIEQAAKEVGGSFTNEQKLQHAGPNGVPLTASISLTGRPEPAPAPKAVDSTGNGGN